MNVRSYVIEVYNQYFKEQGVKIKMSDMISAQEAFNIEAVDKFVNNDIDKYGKMEPNQSAERRVVRERYHKSNLRLITLQFAEAVYGRTKKGTQIQTDAMIVESRMFIKTASASCDMYPC